MQCSHFANNHIIMLVIFYFLIYLVIKEEEEICLFIASSISFIQRSSLLAREYNNYKEENK